jgi:hypothetical protein
MENFNKNYVTAGILILLGLLFLGREFNLLSFHWGDLARFWPVLLIVIGLNMVLGKSNSQANSLLLMLCFLAIPFGMMRSCQKDWKQNHHWHWDDDDDDDDDKGDDKEISGFGAVSRSFSEDITADITEASLEMNAGASGIVISDSTQKLFEAETKSTFGGYNLTKKVSDGKANLVFKMDKNDDDDEVHIEFDEKNLNKNETKIQLNSRIPWSLDLNIGVSGANLDLSNYQINKLNLNTGVSGVDIKLGDKANLSKLEIKAGVAGIKIKIPSAVGVKVKATGFLTGQDLPGYTERNGYKYSENYEKSSKKVEINYEGAIGGFEVASY